MVYKNLIDRRSNQLDAFSPFFYILNMEKRNILRMKAPFNKFPLGNFLFFTFRVESLKLLKSGKIRCNILLKLFFSVSDTWGSKLPVIFIMASMIKS